MARRKQRLSMKDESRCRFEAAGNLCSSEQPDCPGTRLDQHQVGPFTAWSKAYGVTGFSCDGNNVLDTYAATRLAADLAAKRRGPAIIFAETFRMGGHATHDEKEAREIFPPEVFEYWGKRDPIGMYEVIWNGTAVERKVLEETEERVIRRNRLGREGGA